MDPFDTSTADDPRTAPARPRAGARARAAARILGSASAVLLGAVLPVLMVVANKSAPATFGAAALCANAAALLGGQGAALGGRYRALARAPAALLILGIVLLCAASFAWTIDPALTRRGLVEGLPELAFALALAAAWPLVWAPRDARWLALGLLAAGALIVFERATGMPIHALVRARGEAWDLKRSAIPPLFLLWPALLALAGSRRRWLGAALVASVALGAAAAHSGAPVAALAAGLSVAAAALLAPRAAFALTGLGLAALVLAAPWTGSAMGRLLPSEATETLRDQHAEERLAIWHAFERRGFDRPLLGHGFDASFKVAVTPRPDGAPPPPGSQDIVDLHPHDILLQFWVELGVAGLVAASVALCFVMARLRRRRGPGLAARLGLLVSAIGIGLVGLSAWQAWWLASIAAALLWFGHVERGGARPGPGGRPSDAGGDPCAASRA